MRVSAITPSTAQVTWISCSDFGFVEPSCNSKMVDHAGVQPRVLQSLPKIRTNAMQSRPRRMVRHSAFLVKNSVVVIDGTLYTKTLLKHYL